MNNLQILLISQLTHLSSFMHDFHHFIVNLPFVANELHKQSVLNDVFGFKADIFIFFVDG